MDANCGIDIDKEFLLNRVITMSTLQRSGIRYLSVDA